MATRYDERDYERNRQNYGRRPDSEYGRSYGQQSQRRYRYDDSDRETERYGRRSEYSRRYSPGPDRGYQTREGYGGEAWESDWDYSSGRERGSGDVNRYGRSYDDDWRYSNPSSGFSPRYNYPASFRSRETYGERGRGEYEPSDYGHGDERGWWDRTSDEVASWFGDEEAERRRRMDRQREQFRGRGPKGYRRSDERIREDVNDRLSDGYLDASDIEVAVANTEVTLTGSVNSRLDKRRAEDIAESVSGVTNVENRLRVRQSSLDRYSGRETTGTTGSLTSATSATGRGKGAGS